MGRNKKDYMQKYVIKLKNNSVISDNKQVSSEFVKHFNSIPTKTQDDLPIELFNYEELIPISNRSIYLY